MCALEHMCGAELQKSHAVVACVGEEAGGRAEQLGLPGQSYR